MRTKLFLLGTLTALMLAGCDKPQDGQNPDPKTTDPGVVINGIKWATCNVDQPGTFASTPQSPGMFYQWGRKTGWSATDPMKAYDANGEIPGATWDDTYYEGDEWLAENDPCPEGWRVPTKEDFAKLCDKTNVDRIWSASPAGYTFTDKATGNSVFFPASGYRNYATGVLSTVGSGGSYWSALPNSTTNGYNLNFNSSNVNPVNNNNRSNGFSVRPVAEL
jgi:uncharacterized protein (TIGR02145 family)